MSRAISFGILVKMVRNYTDAAGEGYPASGGGDLVYTPVAEAVFDMDLYPHEILPSINNATYSQVDIRRFAHDAAMRAVAYVRGVNYEPSIVSNALRDIPDGAEMRAIRTLLQPHSETIRRKVVRAHYLHNAQSFLEKEEWSDAGLQARADFQHSVIEAIGGQMQRVRIQRSDPHNTEEILQNGTVIVAPPGAGKTFMATKLLQMCSIGRKIFPEDKQPQTALVAVPTLKLVEQYLSDSPRNMFRALLGWDMPLGEYHGQAKTLRPVTLITHDSLRNAAKNGDIKRGDFDYLVFDEVHHLSAPENFKAMRAVSDSLVGLTASPFYRENRNLHRWFPHEGGGNFVDFIHAGILNPVELATYISEDEEHSAAVAAKIMAEWIDDGLRVAAYCKPGGSGAEARRVTAVANAILGRELVKQVGRFKGNTSEQNLSDFSNGDTRGLTLTGMLKEGWDDEVDGVIIVGKRRSRTSVLQMSGRISRLGKRMSKLAEVLTHAEAEHRHTLRIWHALGIDPVSDMSTILLHDTANGSRLYDAHEETVTKSANYAPYSLQRHMTIAPNIESVRTPENLVLADTLAEEFGTTAEHVSTMLVKNARLTEYSRLSMHGSQLQSQRDLLFDAEAARAYLAENPPVRIGKGARSVHELTRLFNLPSSTLSEIAREMGIQTSRLIHEETGELCRVYTADAVAKITEAVEVIPFASEDDVIMTELRHEIDKDFLAKTMATFNIAAQKKRLIAIASVRGVKEYITAAQAEMLRQEYRRFNGNLELVYSQKRLPNHMVLRTAAQRRFSLSDEKTRSILADIRGEQTTIAPGDDNEPMECITWDTLQAIENSHLATDNLAVIEYNRLPYEGAEDDESADTYAAIVRAFYGQLSRSDNYIEFAQAATALSITKPALRHFIRKSDLKEQGGETLVAMSALVRTLPETVKYSSHARHQISARSLIMQYDRFGRSREEMSKIVMKLAFVSPGRTIFLRPDPSSVGDIYFTRQQILPYIHRLP